MDIGEKEPKPIATPASAAKPSPFGPKGLIGGMDLVGEAAGGVVKLAAEETFDVKIPENKQPPILLIPPRREQRSPQEVSIDVNGQNPDTKMRRGIIAKRPEPVISLGKSQKPSSSQVVVPISKT